MAKSNYTASDLIGKKLVLRSGIATYEVYRVKDGICWCTFRREGLTALAVPIKASLLLKEVKQGLMRLSNKGHK